MRARIDISEVEARTKIRAKYLRAIENEDWDLLPGPVFVKSFLKTYGDYLGVDSRPLIDEFKRRYENPSDHDSAADRGPRQGARAGRTGPRQPAGAPRRGHRARAGGRGRDPLPDRARQQQNTGDTGVGHGTPSSPTRKRRERCRRGEDHDYQNSHHDHPAGAKVATLTLAQVTAPVWVCVEDAKGTKLINGVIYNPGQTIPTVKAAELLVNLGTTASP